MKRWEGCTKMKRIIGLFVIITLFIVGCSANQDDQVTPENDIDHQEDDEQTTEDDPDQDAASDESAYEEVTLERSILPIVNVQIIDDEQIVTLRLEQFDHTMSEAEQFMQALAESDQTGYKTFQEHLLDVSIEGSTATLVFSEDHMLPSLASTESLHLEKTLNQLGTLFDIDELVFYVNDERGISYGQMGEIETLPLEHKPYRGYAKLVEAETDSEEPVYVPSYQLNLGLSEESSFEETLMAMTDPSHESRLFATAIPSTISIEAVIVEGDEVQVSYQGEASDAFDQLIQQVAQDYDYTTLNLINETEQTITVLPIE